MGEANTEGVAEGDRHTDVGKRDREEVERPKRRPVWCRGRQGECWRREGEAGIDRGEGAEISG